MSLERLASVGMRRAEEGVTGSPSSPASPVAAVSHAPFRSEPGDALGDRYGAGRVDTVTRPTEFGRLAQLVESACLTTRPGPLPFTLS